MAFCPKCGRNLAENERICTACGAPTCVTPPPPVNAGGVVPVSIDSGMTGAILVTLFCCLPLGIVAIVKASSVSSLLLANRIDEAKEAASSAKKWTLLALILGLIANIFLFLFYVILGIAAA